MSYFLCGQTGNTNRGCEAIIRSTVKVLGQRNGDIYVATFAPERDRKMVRELGINMIPYNGYPTPIHRYGCGIIRRVFKKSVFGDRYVASSLYAHMKPDDISLNIGGDTYCYGRPLYSIALNRYTSKHGIPNILWCCSVEKDAIHGEVLDDLNTYRYIFAREQISYNSLIESGVQKERVVKVCDPAFFLDQKTVPLPQGFVEGNTVGLNVSECVITENDSYVYENVLHMAQYILQQTDMSICLIPHVYNIAQNQCDWPILQQLKKDLNSNRISIVDQEYDCEQLKYIISKCRFMVCARTHASIAAYSTEVPTLVLGYSVKSKGIATDLFGRYDNYVVSYQELTEANELTKAFQFIQEHEQEIRGRLHSFLPEYKQQLLDAITTYLPKHTQNHEFHICDQNLCNGCGACVAACTQKCIKMERNAEGFLYPTVDDQRCIRCGKCRHICPVANRYRDDNVKPDAHAVMIKDEGIRLSSSSGGAFTVFAEKVLEEGGVVFGAAFDYSDGAKVKHKYIEAKTELEQIRGSKYVQSEIGETYQQAKVFLEQGRQVLYVGTPCQIGGLHAFLGKKYANLITVDFVCHGVPSPKVWDKYVKFREATANAPARRIFFRHKNCGWKRYSIQFEFSNCMEYLKVLTEDIYMRGFLAHLFLRPSCHECAFKNVHRMSDITLADYWGVEKISPEKNDDRGISLVLVHSGGGRSLLESCKDRIERWTVDFDAAIKDNQSTLSSATASRLRKRFFRDVDRLPMDWLMEKYCGRSFVAKIRRGIAKL